MTLKNRPLLRWVILFGWIAVIHFLSGPRFGFVETLGFSKAFNLELNFGLSDEALINLTAVIRKLAHLSEYAVLAILLASASGLPRGRPFYLYAYDLLLVFLLVAGIAWIDEATQLFVTGRVGQLSDVAIDLGGGAIGLAIYRLSRDRDAEELERYPLYY